MSANDLVDPKPLQGLAFSKNRDAIKKAVNPNIGHKRQKAYAVVNKPIISLRDDMEVAAPSLLSPFCGSSRWQRWSSMRLLWNLLRRSKKQSSSEGSRPSFCNENNKSLTLSTKSVCLICRVPVFSFSYFLLLCLKRYFLKVRQLKYFKCT